MGALRRIAHRLAIACAAIAAATLAGGEAPGREGFTWEAAPAVAARPGQAGAPLVVLLTIDGVRWQEVFEGVDRALAAEAGLPASAVVPAAALVPNLTALAARGVAVGAPPGPPMQASGPVWVSLPGYREILEGRPPDDCRDNGCPAASAPTLLDRIRARTPARSGVVAFASWEECARAASAEPGSIVLSAGREPAPALDGEDGATRGAFAAGLAADPWPGHGRYRPDRLTGALALRWLDRHRPTFAWIALGDTDELAHRRDYAGYLAALRRADELLGALVARLDGPRTAFLVTTDHGRGATWNVHGTHPSSARVFLVAGGGAIRAANETAGREHRLADVAPTILALLGIDPRDPRPGAGAPIEEILAPLRGDTAAR